MASNFGPQPEITEYKYQPGNGPYGTHVSYDKGYGVKTPDIQAGKGAHTRTWNALLVDPYGRSVKMWVDNFQTSFAMNGAFAQSRHTRQFFPRSFAQPTVTVHGRMPNSFQYNRLAAFIREAHATALDIDVQAKAQRAAGVVSSRHYNDGSANPTMSLHIRTGGTPAKHNAKGEHLAQNLQGYVKRIDAGGERFNNAPEFTFEFVVAYSTQGEHTGIYTDSVANGSQILPWLDIFKNSFQGSGNAAFNFGKEVDTAVQSFGDAAQELGNGIGDAIGGIGDILSGL